MDIKVRVLTAEESWEHLLRIYRMYHAKYKEGKNIINTYEAEFKGIIAYD